MFAIRVIIRSQCERVEVVTCEGGNHFGQMQRSVLHVCNSRRQTLLHTGSYQLCEGTACSPLEKGRLIMVADFREVHTFYSFCNEQTLIYSLHGDI